MSGPNGGHSKNDPVAQTRAALSQLYHYRFVYREDLSAPALLAVFGRRPAGLGGDLVRFLDECAIAVFAREDGDTFEGTALARTVAPLLFR